MSDAPRTSLTAGPGGLVGPRASRSSAGTWLVEGFAQVWRDGDLHAPTNVCTHIGCGCQLGCCLCRTTWVSSLWLQVPLAQRSCPVAGVRPAVQSMCVPGWLGPADRTRCSLEIWLIGWRVFIALYWSDGSEGFTGAGETGSVCRTARTQAGLGPGQLLPAGLALAGTTVQALCVCWHG